MDQLLNIIVKHWKEDDFVGISGLHLADILAIDHQLIIEELKRLEQNGLVSLQKTQLGQGSKFNEIKLDNGDTIKIPYEWEMTDTVIAFPKRHILEATFQAEGKDYGYFTNRLHKGDSQIRHYYFKRDVLDKYLRFKNMYLVDEDSNGGSISTKYDYFSSLPEEVQDKEAFGTIRFGSFKLQDESLGIGAIAIDVSQLPQQEQLYWAAYEIQKPQLSNNNEGWKEHIEEIFEGSWEAQHIDYVKLFSETLEQINAHLNESLFIQTSNPHLHIPVLNTERDYIETHKELFKLLSADNLNGDLLKKLLLSLGSSESDFLNGGGREKGKWALFKMLCKKFNVDVSKLELVNTNRQISSHKIAPNFSTPAEYYPEKFKNELRELILELDKLK